MGSTLSSRLLASLGLVLILAAVASGWGRVRTGGTDFAVLHAMGVAIARGANVYALNDPGETREDFAGVRYPPSAMGIVVYPPATGFPLLPLGALPYGPAKILWFLLMNAIVVAGVRALVREVCPRAPRGAWMIAAGVVLMSASIRWGMMLLQGAPFVLGLLCFFVVALHSRRPWIADAIAAVAVVFKMTLGLPFLGLLLLGRRLRGVIACGVALVGLNLLGFARMGAASYATYRRSAADFDALGADNINSPDPWSAIARPRMDWVSLFYGVGGHVHLARLLSLACAGAVSLWLLREGWRTRPPLRLSSTAAFLGPLVCLDLLCVYHHHYDTSLLFAPLLIATFGASEWRRPSWAVALALPLVAIIVLLPIGVAQDLAQSLLGDRGPGVLKLAFPVTLSLGLIATLVMLHRAVAARFPG